MSQEPSDQQIACWITEYDERILYILGYRRMRMCINAFNHTNYSRKRIQRIMGIVKTEMYGIYDEESLHKAIEDSIFFCNHKRLQERFHSQSSIQVRMLALQTKTPEVFPIEENKRIMKYKEHLAELVARA